MVERVYGRMSPNELGTRMAQVLGTDCRKYAADHADKVHISDTLDSGGDGKMLETKRKMVPRDRIELPTRGFSVPCSTD